MPSINNGWQQRATSLVPVAFVVIGATLAWRYGRELLATGGEEANLGLIVAAFFLADGIRAIIRRARTDSHDVNRPG
jgi:hypothetical protein